MFDLLFASKNKKLVSKLHKEHEKIVVLAENILAAYDQKDFKSLRKNLETLKELSLTHLMTEDVEFYNLVKDPKRTTAEIKKLVVEFDQNFGAIKLALIRFLDKYTDVKANYSSEFIVEFKKIADVLSQRISFEEANLYEVLKES